MRRVIILTALFYLSISQLLSAQNNQKNRVIILSDIEADPDDTQSFVRLLLYSNQIDIKGMVATTSCWYRNSVEPESIEKVIQSYGKVQPNLLKHEAGFPSEKELLSLPRSLNL